MLIDAQNITFKQHYITHILYVTYTGREYSGKDKKDGQPGIGLAKPCVATRGPEALSQYTTGLP
jgi:hypothetical protein